MRGVVVHAEVFVARRAAEMADFCLGEAPLNNRGLRKARAKPSELGFALYYPPLQEVPSICTLPTPPTPLRAKNHPA